MVACKLRMLNEDLRCEIMYMCTGATEKCYVGGEMAEPDEEMATIGYENEPPMTHYHGSLLLDMQES